MFSIKKRYLDKCLQVTRDYYQCCEPNSKEAENYLDDRNVYCRVACEDVPYPCRFSIECLIRDFTNCVATNNKSNETLYKMLQLFDIEIIGG